MKVSMSTSLSSTGEIRLLRNKCPPRLSTCTKATILEMLDPAAAKKSEAKKELLDLISDTSRGFRATRLSRGAIEEAQVAVENFSGTELQYNLLEGKWKLLFTTASDVLPILGAETRLTPLIGPSPLQVGNIYQTFSSVEKGVVQNIIELSAPFLLQEYKGVTVTVQARYEVRSPHRISLVFDEARVGSLRISEGLEALIAPAMLPRGSLQHRLLLGIKEFQLRFPFNSARQLVMRASGDVDPIRGGGDYQLTYLDEDMLIGRATTLGGSFIFIRESAGI
ncbi:hypothetical protein CEUSTIGMA_g316.t1 [Chlamydomonas eustigma]|uniref:Plastid lipid-associated protein/fibrillin conserved domain-containing protein n=1 Tax=Chlamydomonas eustigma TaxID=1157962 RepID=A0A250WPY8_9CHLO|nr:hypothetical protein CEUSTIGMA_g316.t1 [Chlamydomonas eustigma]|eukprot:GAX72861.1 hypothetical protein CEUSTIGMA_g316.t1 [Chlamydomonas eustigma]